MKELLIVALLLTMGVVSGLIIANIYIVYWKQISAIESKLSSIMDKLLLDPICSLIERHYEKKYGKIES